MLVLKLLLWESSRSLSGWFVWDEVNLQHLCSMHTLAFVLEAGEAHDLCFCYLCWADKTYLRIYFLDVMLRRIRKSLMSSNEFSSKVKQPQPEDMLLNVLLVNISSFVPPSTSIKSPIVISVARGKYVPVWVLLPISSLILDKLL